jgi:outer membrane protein assembly factor BamC
LTPSFHLTFWHGRWAAAAENPNVNLPVAATPSRLAVLALATALAGCSSIEGLFSGDKVDYRSGAVKAKPLEVPPDLTQLAKDSRYSQQSGVVSAAASAQGTPGAVAVPALATVAPTSAGRVRIERQGNQRWLVADATPEALWPEVRAFWVERGFTLTLDNAQAGLLETDWAENRAKLPNDLIRSTLGRVIDKLYDTGIRDRYRTRLERTPSGTEIYISHRGLEEVYVGDRKEGTVWQPRNADAQLETEMLTRLMVRLGSKEEAARAAVASAPDTPAKARALTDPKVAALELDEPFDRAWRRVGLALDRSGFTVEDRDRSAGLYYVRYIDPKTAGKEEPGFFARLFGASTADPKLANRYRVEVKSSGAKSVVAVLGSNGQPEASEVGRNIVGLLVKDLR